MESHLKSFGNWSRKKIIKKLKRKMNLGMKHSLAYKYKNGKYNDNKNTISLV